MRQQIAAVAAAASGDKLAKLTEALLHQGYAQHGSWVQFGDLRELPTEGWKLHVSPASADAAGVSGQLLALLKQAGIVHKVAPGLDAYERLSSTQAGKLITIYPRNSAELAKAVTLAQSVLQQQLTEQPVAVADEQALSPGLSARYGTFGG